MSTLAGTAKTNILVERRRQSEHIRAALQIFLVLAGLTGGPLLAQEVSVRTIGFGNATDVSKDGGRILLTDWKTGKIMLRDVESGAVEVVTRGGYPDYGMYAQFSPDGKRVAYSWRVRDGHFDLRLITLDSSEPRVLVPGKNDSYFVRDWSRDGKTILARTSSGLVSVSAEDGNVENLVEIPKPSFGESARFSPNGEYVAYAMVTPSITAPADIHIYSLSGRRELEGVRHPANDGLIGWTPDGRWILFSSDRDGMEGLWAAPVDAEGAGEARRIHESLALARPWSVGVTGDGSPVYTARTWRNDLYIADYDTERNAFGKPIVLVKDVDYGSGVTWSPAGDRLAYARHPRSLVIRSYPGGQEQEIDTGLRRFHHRGPHWIGDETILVGARPNGREAGLVAVDVPTGEVATIIENDDKGVVEWGTASPAGLAYFPRFQVEGDGEFVERNMKTAAERTIHRFQAIQPGRWPVRDLALSADGEWLAYVQKGSSQEPRRESLALLKVGGGPPKTLLKANPGEVLYQPAWTPDSRFLLLGRGRSIRPESKFKIWRVDVSSEEAECVTGFSFSGKNMGGLSVHPDGDKIAFTSGEVVDEWAVTWTELRDEVRIVEGVAEWLARHER